MSILLLLYGIDTPTADPVVPPVVPPVVETVAVGPPSGGGMGIGSGVKKRRRALAYERENMTTPEWLLADDEDVLVILQ